MANIRITCPECGSVLEIDARFEGQVVECGSCLKTFVAKTTPPAPAGQSGGAGESGSRGGSGAGSSSRGRSHGGDDERNERSRRGGDREERSRGEGEREERSRRGGDRDERGDRDRPARSSRGRDDGDRDRNRDRRQDDEYDDEFSPDPRGEKGTPTLAVVSLVLGIINAVIVAASIIVGIVGMCCCLALPCLAWIPLPFTFACSIGATVTGALAVRNPDGRPLAITGLVLGVLCLGFAILQLIFGFAPFMAPVVAPPPPQQVR